MTSDHDQHQFQLMLDRIGGYRSQAYNLARTIDDLDGLLNALEEIDDEWRQIYLHYWGQLEDVNAAAIFRSATAFNEDETRVLDSALLHLQLLVLEKMESKPALVILPPRVDAPLFSKEGWRHYYDNPDVEWLDAGMSVSGGRLSQSGYYVIPMCGHIECCAPAGPFKSIDTAKAWSRQNCDRGSLLPEEQPKPPPLDEQ